MLAKIAKGESLELSLERIKEINRVVLEGLILEDRVVPGEVRTYSVGVATYRGAPAQDCVYLLTRLCDWLNGSDFEPRDGLGKMHMAILKAIVAHLYIEWIHPFGDGNGRTGRLVEVQILIAAGVPSPAGHLLSNHYNETRTDYFAQLKAASESKGETLPFFTYALNGFLDGLKEQLDYVRVLQFEVTWTNYVHDFFRDENTKSAKRKKTLLLEIIEKTEPVPITELDQLSPKLARAYAGMHPRTCARDVESLVSDKLLLKQGKNVEPNRGLIAQFLPICADRFSPQTT
jgi:Fic family protein